MKNYYYLIIGIVSLLFSSCVQDKDMVYTDEPSYSIEVEYSDFISNIQKKIDYQASKLGWIGTKGTEKSGLMDVLFQLPQEELLSMIQKYDENGLLDKIEMKQDSVFGRFFLLYSDVDYEKLNNSLDCYLKNGGHDAKLLISICKKLPSSLINGYVYMCA